MSSKLTGVIPQLPSLNLKKSKQFYAQKLGFKVYNESRDFIVIGKDRIELHLWLCNNKTVPQNTSCYIHVHKIDRLYEDYKRKGILQAKDGLEEKSWGMKEFCITDDSGNLLKFGEPIY